ncbi:hypothetical protein [Lactobacillus crispatus]|uniref:Uncharacterized protein n=1 Tax=Lactobacillus crispatus TaxID=47770 RepID=A0A7H9E868_9LACO|nr:hypothetical protein [Lactobacillus crispatus]QLL73840.1 hypothetical protein GTO85_05415 [Lactobacillus crispatus]
MKITVEGSPQELKDFFSTDVNGEKLWAAFRKEIKKDQDHIDHDLDL